VLGPGAQKKIAAAGELPATAISFVGGEEGEGGCLLTHTIQYKPKAGNLFPGFFAQTDRFRS
jgi:hypothetical protein